MKKYINDDEILRYLRLHSRLKRLNKVTKWKEEAVENLRLRFCLKSFFHCLPRHLPSLWGKKVAHNPCKIYYYYTLHCLRTNACGNHDDFTLLYKLLEKVHRVSFSIPLLSMDTIQVVNQDACMPNKIPKWLCMFTAFKIVLLMIIKSTFVCCEKYFPFICFQKKKNYQYLTA